jgi:AraC-like DNA-binding protein
MLKIFVILFFILILHLSCAVLLATIILPPWWLPTFVLTIYALLILFGIYLAFHLRTQGLKSGADKLKRLVDKRTLELAKEREKVLQLLEQKNDEFANLSHEFRTPQTLNLDELTDTCTIKQINKQQMFIEQLNNILEKQYIDTSTTVNIIAKAMAMSERQFFRKLKSTLGVTPAEYLKRFRLKKSCFLLAQGQSAINTALDAGFSSQSYFSKCFKNEYGYLPSEFRKRLLARNKKINALKDS